MGKPTAKSPNERSGFQTTSGCRTAVVLITKKEWGNGDKTRLIHSSGFEQAKKKNHVLQFYLVPTCRVGQI